MELARIWFLHLSKSYLLYFWQLYPFFEYGQRRCTVCTYSEFIWRKRWLSFWTSPCILLWRARIRQTNVCRNPIPNRSARYDKFYILDSLNDLKASYIFCCLFITSLTSLWNKKNFSDVTAVQFSVSFSQIKAAKKTRPEKNPPKMGQLWHH